jgi:hypothetical protein
MQKKYNQKIIIENISINLKKKSYADSNTVGVANKNININGEKENELCRRPDKSYADGYIYADGGYRHSLSYADG